MDDKSDFDQWLQKQLTYHSEHLNDDGFTDKVMAAVPARRRRGALASAIWTSVLALLAGALGLVLFPGWNWAYDLAMIFASLPLTTLVQLGLGVTVTLAAIAAATLWNEA